MEFIIGLSTFSKAKAVAYSAHVVYILTWKRSETVHAQLIFLFVFLVDFFCAVELK